VPRCEIVDASVVAVRALIVDDNDAFLEGAAALLRRQGMEVLGVASNSLQALRLVEKLRPDVVLVDINLGDEDGFALAEKLVREHGEVSRVVLVSTQSEEDLSQLIGASPAAAFISKSRLSAQAISAAIDGAGAC
jgi:DNA-binding NarL/FixJ family response regulator